MQKPRSHIWNRVAITWTAKGCSSLLAGSSGLQKASQLGRGLKLRDRLQLLERRGEGVGQAPQSARLKFLVLRLEIEVMDRPGQVFGHFQIGLDERLNAW